LKAENEPAQDRTHNGMDPLLIAVKAPPRQRCDTGDRTANVPRAARKRSADLGRNPSDRSRWINRVLASQEGRSSGTINRMPFAEDDQSDRYDIFGKNQQNAEGDDRNGQTVRQGEKRADRAIGLADLSPVIIRGLQQRPVRRLMIGASAGRTPATAAGKRGVMKIENNVQPFTADHHCGEKA
jgi:hypothetical protein